MPDGLVRSSDVSTYVKGCISRERERLARIFETNDNAGDIAKAIRDRSHDDRVFEWIGSGKKLP